MASQNRHRQVQCHVCMKMMRSDHLQRHIESKHDGAEIPGITEQAKIDNDLYFKNIETGKHLHDLIVSGEIEQESLSKENAYAFGLYNKMRPILDVESVELRPWQQHVMQLLEEPTARQVIWIKGSYGNEGKSWLQSYIQSLYGYARTVRLDFKSKVNDIYCAISKRPLATTDIFLINDPRSAPTNAIPCYSVLEAIKDGIAINGKYQSEVVRFKTPNVVIVFSNNSPDVSQLSRDRWNIFNINMDGLNRIDGRICERKLCK